jgi:hypothetical protein
VIKRQFGNVTRYEIPDPPMSFPDADNLLRTKRLPPRPRPPLIRRAALLAQLDAALACKLTICGGHLFH